MRIVQTKDLKEVIEVETGFVDTNLWMEWIQYTARSMAKEECYACGTAKHRGGVYGKAFHVSRKA